MSPYLIESKRFQIVEICRCFSVPLSSIYLPPPAPTSNARPLISRNKREGGYCGWRPFGPRKRDCQTPAGHVRAGQFGSRTLRGWAKEWK